MKRFLGLFLAAGVGVQVGRMIEGGSKTAAAGGGQGGGVTKCSSQNGDVNADGKVDLSDAVTTLNFLFLGNPTELVGLCVPPELEACQADLAAAQAALATTQAELASSQEKLAQCQAGKASALPDTGQTKCYDQSGAEIPCDGATCAGQDASYATGCPSEGRFTDNGDGTVTDHCTGLMWQKDTADVNGDGQTPDNGSDTLPWCAALAYCENLSFAGHDDWRLPNVRELQSIVDYGRFNPSIDPVFGALSSWYWSSTSYAFHPVYAWLVIFANGGLFAGLDVKVGRFYVRAVRSGP